MAHYTFRIHQGSHSSDVPVDLENDDAAWDEAAMVCYDLFQDTITRLRDSPEWRLEVAGCGFLATSSELLDVKSVPDAIRPTSYNFNDQALNNVW